MTDIFNISSVSQFHELLGLPAPEHPLITFINDRDVDFHTEIDESLYGIRFSSDMYSIMYKDKISGSLGYGRNSYDYQEGTLIFGSPGQVFTSPTKDEIQGKEGWTLLFHPDLLAKSNLGEQMDQYSYFSYEVTEALHLSSKEEGFIVQVMEQIKTEYSQNLDKHSQGLILSNLELLLNYCMRFYDRQFYTRTNLHSDFVSEFESTLKKYFGSELIVENGLPSTSYFGRELNMSASYLSDMLKKETGKSTKEHIDNYIVRKAKNILLSSNQSVSEIAFGLGFEYPQSFTRMFKKKTGMSPNEYRQVN
ncbi:AraC family transcriptional regulator [Cryomorphaceae bacterium]|nr:AraC family transcriptional regulator [Cryomorphaceae bacterium]